ncbi:MAG: hypothetical protein PHV06_00590 [bacterium]|nr:hypothetical protein [bacterium]
MKNNRKKDVVDSGKIQSLIQTLKTQKFLTTTDLNIITEEYNKRAEKQFPWMFWTIAISVGLVVTSVILLASKNSIAILFTFYSLLFIIGANTWLAFYLSKCPYCNKSFAKKSKTYITSEDYNYTSTNQDGSTYSGTRRTKLYCIKCKYCGKEWVTFSG